MIFRIFRVEIEVEMYCFGKEKYIIGGKIKIFVF